jgi:hypothetical protein
VACSPRGGSATHRGSLDPTLAVESAPASRGAQPTPVVAVAFAPAQGEYGERSRSEQVSEIIAEWLAAWALPWFELTMDLYEKPNRRRPDQVESLVRRADLVVSMRLHGLVLGLKHGRPVISVDPVAGGAKVAAQARALGWPLVMPGEAPTPTALDAALDRCVSGELSGAVTAAREVGSAGNEGAREWLTHRLRS